MKLKAALLRADILICRRIHSGCWEGLIQQVPGGFSREGRDRRSDPRKIVAMRTFFAQNSQIARIRTRAHSHALARTRTHARTRAHTHSSIRLPSVAREHTDDGHMHCRADLTHCSVWPCHYHYMCRHRRHWCGEIVFSVRENMLSYSPASPPTTALRTDVLPTSQSVHVVQTTCASLKAERTQAG